ncbi:MAG: cystathionine gamma-synthase family protein [Acidilobaceae archaeon]
MGKATEAIHGHEFRDEVSGAFIPPIYLTAIFEQRGETRLTDRGTELKYSREENPTVRALEKVIAKLEGGSDALAFNSGMAAISAVILGLVKRDYKILVPIESYGTSLELIQSLGEKIGFKIKLSWPETEAIMADIVSEKPDIVFIESMTNPTLRVLDVSEICKVCLEEACWVIVDNTFTTPILLNPLKYGSIAIVHSTTKYIAGHNDVVGGAIVSNESYIKYFWDWRRMLGSIMQPFEAYLTIRGLKTLNIRVERSSTTAKVIAEYLSDHSRVEDVYYPGLNSSPYNIIAKRIFQKDLYGGVVSFKVKGGRDEALKVLRKVKIIKPSPSLGGPESLLTYPVISASRYIPEDARRKLGITDNLLRLSVGLEDSEDLIEDLSQALE